MQNTYPQRVANATHKVLSLRVLCLKRAPLGSGLYAPCQQETGAAGQDRWPRRSSGVGESGKIKVTQKHAHLPPTGYAKRFLGVFLVRLRRVSSRNGGARRRAGSLAPSSSESRLASCCQLYVPRRHQDKPRKWGFFGYGDEVHWQRGEESENGSGGGAKGGTRDLTDTHICNAAVVTRRQSS